MLIHLVRVTTDDRQSRLWASATAREDAVDRVLDAIPEGWTACLLDERPRDNVSMNMTQGEVRELRVASAPAQV